MKYFIVYASGKQYCLEPNKWQDIDYLKKSKLGSFILLKRILLYKNTENLQIGTPFLENSSIVAKVIQQVKKKKFIVLKTKPKKNYTRKKGHIKYTTRIILN